MSHQDDGPRAVAYALLALLAGVALVRAAGEWINGGIHFCRHRWRHFRSRRKRRLR